MDDVASFRKDLTLEMIRIRSCVYGPYERDLRSYKMNLKPLVMPSLSGVQDEDPRRAPSEVVSSHINKKHSVNYKIVRRLLGGYASDTYLVLDVDAGANAVLKWTEDKHSASKVLAAGPVVAQARAQGWPTPKWIVYGTTLEGYPYAVQEYIPLASASHLNINGSVARSAVDFIDRFQKGIRLDTEVDWTERDRSTVFNAHNDFVARLCAHSQDGADFVKLVEDWTRPYRHAKLPTTDLVHGDFQPGNYMLAEDGRIAYVIDVEALGKGSRFHDVADLFGHCVIWDGSPEVFRILDEYARSNAATGEWEVSLAARLLELLFFYIFDFKGDARAVLDRATRGIHLVQERCERAPFA